jgi:protocatechuate 3,4-dioxygenase beta subunit
MTPQQLAAYRQIPDSEDPSNYPEYKSTGYRFPKRPLFHLPPSIGEVTGPLLGEDRVGEHDHDLTVQGTGEPIGERIIVHGRLLDSGGRPLPGQLVEIWQANACGRYLHKVDQHPAPLDPNFTGVGRAVTDADGRYRFITIKPGAYPWGNHPNAWRPQHIHFSLTGRAVPQRLVTQMYFPGDPLFEYDPIYQSVHDEGARRRMVSRFDLDATIPDWALAYEWDIVLRGRDETFIETAEEHG